MDPAEPPSPYPPADFRRRSWARGLDLLLAQAPLLLLPGHLRAAVILSAALLLANDALLGPGRSLGKRLAGLRVIALATRRPCSLRESVLRNAVFVLGLLPAALGPRRDLALAAVFGIALVESLVALQPLTRDLGQRRLGDLFAGTQVIDGSLALGLPAPRVAAPRAATPLASRAALRPTKEAPCASP